MIGELLFGRYRVESLQASSAHGQVWRGLDTQTDGPVSIKLWAEDDSERALLEGEAMAALRHDNVVRLVDFGLLEGGRPCLVMEGVDGLTLAQALTEVGRMSWFEVFDLGAQVLEGLAALHDEGLVHRNISPNAIIIRSGIARRIKLVGLDQVSLAAADGDPLSFDTSSSSAAGYAAPELLAGTGCRPASDIYSLGIVLWQAISGHAPFVDMPVDIACRIAFRPDFDRLPPGSPMLPVAARLALDRMLRPSLPQRDADARLVARRLRAALGVQTAPKTDTGTFAQAVG